MKFIYFTDVHYGANPVCRKDNYNESILKKLKYIIEYAADNEIQMFVCGGDMFDRPHQNYNDLIELFCLIKFSDMKWIINRGNPTHDGIVENSPLTLMASMDSNIITSDFKQAYEYDNCVFYFYPNSVDLDKMNTDIITEYGDEKSQRFLLTHHILVEKPVPYKHFLCQDFAEKIHTDCTVFIADYHPAQGEFVCCTEDGSAVVRFISPGSICRRKYTKDNIEKVPHFVVFDSDTGSCEFVEIPCEKDIWNIPEDEHIQETEFDIETFRENIDDFQTEMNLESAWNKYVALNDIPFDVANLILENIKKGFVK